MIKFSPLDLKALSFLIRKNLKFEEDDTFFMDFYCKEEQATAEDKTEETN